MKIGFDVSPLCRPHPLGIVRATRGLVRELEKRERFQIVRLEPPAGEALGRWRRVGIPDAIREYALDLVHSPVSAFAPFGPGLRVQTIHELPWLANVSENADWRHRAWAAIGPLHADRVVCGSESTAAEVRAGSPLAASRVRTCSWGVDPIFSREARDDERALAQLGLDEVPFVLCAGAVRAKKNLAATIRGVAHLRRRVREKIAIVVTGERTRDLVLDLLLAEDLGLGDAVRAVGEVDDATLAVLARRAIAAIVLSRSEGFGFPVVEAQACGTPAIVPLEGAHAEIAGQAGLRVDPSDAESVADGIVRALAGRERLSALSSENAALFTWNRCATAIEDVWEELA